MASGIYKCHDCHMSFNTMQLLNKHKRKFCIGGSLGDPDNLMLRRPLRSVDSPRSISPVESVEYTRYNPNQDARIQQLAETHGRQMEYLNLRNRDLEKQRDDIRRRLEQLGTKGVKVDPDNTAQLLEELRAQERRNQQALEDLRRQLQFMNQPRHTVIEVEKSGQQQPLILPPPPPPPPQPQPDTGRKSYVYPIYYGNSLVAEISAVRQAYLQNGGNDPDVLAQMAQLQAEAQNIEDAMKQQGMDRRPPKEKKDSGEQLKSLELENERLHRELMLLQEMKLKQKSDREDELERELRRLHAEHLAKMMQLQHELELLKQRMMLEKQQPQPIRIETSQPPPAQPPPPPRPYVEVEPMAPYDQYAGFVIFYDFVLNMDPRVTACRLIVGLHSTSAVVGDPTVLPTVYTEPATRGSYYQNSSNAVIGARQPVPKCPPQADLGIVVELQTSGGPASDYDKHSLITRAWTKLPIFDNDGNIIAGKFRIPMRNVPIKPYLHASQLQSLNKYGEVELYYRLVNMRDAEVQSLINISAANYSQYRAPEPTGTALTPYTARRTPPPAGHNYRISG